MLATRLELSEKLSIEQLRRAKHPGGSFFNEFYLLWQHLFGAICLPCPFAVGHILPLFLIFREIQRLGHQGAPGTHTQAQPLSRAKIGRAALTVLVVFAGKTQVVGFHVFHGCFPSKVKLGVVSDLPITLVFPVSEA